MGDASRPEPAASRMTKGERQPMGAVALAPRPTRRSSASRRALRRRGPRCRPSRCRRRTPGRRHPRSPGRRRDRSACRRPLRDLPPPQRAPRRVVSRRRTVWPPQPCVASRRGDQGARLAVTGPAGRGCTRRAAARARSAATSRWRYPDLSEQSSGLRLAHRRGRPRTSRHNSSGAEAAVDARTRACTDWRRGWDLNPRTSLRTSTP
jgi:hypothetical protein